MNDIGHKKSYDYKFTVFTPTYNRRHVLHRVCDSLKMQSFTDFEWVIVDDGSTDGTEELVKQWMSDCNFPIRYYYQSNSGKHLAFNLGVDKARGELFLSIDSDDACEPHALAAFDKAWKEIAEEKKKDFAGVSALCRDEEGTLVGNKYPKDKLDSNSLELRYKYDVNGDKWGFIRTDVLRQYPFPTTETKVNFIAENIVWDQISQKYQTRFINEVLRIYYIHDKNTSQLTKQSIGKDALANLPYLKQLLSYNLKWMLYAPKKFFGYFVLYTRYNFHIGKMSNKQIKELKGIMPKFICMLALPIGKFLYKRDQIRKISLLVQQEIKQRGLYHFLLMYLHNGAAYLRAMFFKLLFINNISGNIFFLGTHSRFDIFNKHSKISVGKYVFIRKNATIRVDYNSTLKIGDKVFINDNCNINCVDYIEIGEYTKIGQNVAIYDHDHNFKKEEKNHLIKGEVIIGKNVWIGSNVIILRNTHIGDNAVIGAGCVVKGEVPCNSVLINKQNKEVYSYKENLGEI